MASSGMNLVMTTIGFAVSTLFIVFVCTRLICARIQLRASRRSFQIASRSDLSSLERGLHGLEPTVVANFPAKKYSDEYFASAENAQCAVCLTEYHQEDVLRILPHCGHYFHINCIDLWLLQHCTCPVCRISLREMNEKKRLMQPMFSPRYCYGMEPPSMHSHHCPLASHRCSSRSLENRRLDIIQECRSVSRGDSEEAGENIPPLVGESGGRVLKDSKSKQVECPSYA
ncbi:hypothetical protein Nepgr_013077 [Nepenthes gracilis]|uniref:RING-type E3 ubiquitin transferase n=1 Tax=Nepenthes gracilis TaxID=150966 RepID=A0AAD3XNY6_NEPGR|nr:hypothetical protein Nepgr_013077 [Nepenthes gracilis]